MTWAKQALAALAIILAAAACVAAGRSDDRGCTSLFLSASDGTRVFGTNLDYDFSDGRIFVNKRGMAKSGRETGTKGAVAQWISRYGSVTFDLAGFQFVWSGMNEAGLVISTMNLSLTRVPRPDEKPPLASGVWLQYILDTSATVEEALRNAAKVRMAYTVDHYLLSDGSGAAAVIEFLDGKMVVHSGTGLTVSALTNSTYEESVAGWRAMRAPNSSIGRFIIAANGVAAFGDRPAPDAAGYAFSVLAKARQSLTVWTIVFDAGNQKVSFFTKGGPRTRTIDMKKLDFSSATPVLMLDVNADLSGDVTGRFAPYSHTEALAHMTAAFRRFVPSMTTAEVDRFLTFLEFQPVQETRAP